MPVPLVRFETRYYRLTEYFGDSSDHPPSKETGVIHPRPELTHRPLWPKRFTQKPAQKPATNEVYERVKFFLALFLAVLIGVILWYYHTFYNLGK